jgi:peptidoglycan/xylan/chitin deacetylase (PgdA/CDA1 family)
VVESGRDLGNEAGGSSMKRRFGTLLAVGSLAAATGCTIIHPRDSLGIPAKTVVITFDDGPNTHKNVTARVLDVLAKHRVKAHFCVVGVNVEAHPELVRRMRAEGHDIANHGYGDWPAFILPNLYIAYSIDKCDEAIAAVLEEPGFKTAYFRPSFGVYRPLAPLVWRGKGKRVMPLTFYAWDADWAPTDDTSEIVRRTVAGITEQGGGIFVLHDGMGVISRREGHLAWNPNGRFNRDWIPDALDEILTELEAKGYRFALLSEFEPAAPAPDAGEKAPD